MDAVDIFAKNVRLARQRLNLSQEELAHSAGLHRTYVGAVERSQRNITLRSAEKIAVALGCSLSDLLERAKGEQS